MKKIIRHTVLALMMPLTVLFASCEENYLKFDTSYCGIYFTKDTLNYSFGVTPVEVTTHTYNIPVAIMGMPSKEARAFSYEIVPDSTEAIEGVHFTIGDAIILPDSTTGVIPVTIYRNELKGNYSQGYTRYKLCLQLVKDDIFTPTLDSLHQVRVFRFDNAVDQPAWYNAHGEKHWQEKYLGKWHPYKLIKMVEYYHAIETILPETYKKMVDLYGENLEHIPNGDPYQFRTIFVKYIYSPMYEFFNDPENYEMIKSQFPDFPFGDFPNPYAEA